MPFADVGEHCIEYIRRGSGRPLLLIQGMAGSYAIWGEPFLTELEKDFEIVAFNNRGIGASTDVPGNFSITDLSDDAAQLMNAIGWEHADVLGISMGGMIAQELALKYSERIDCLVLGCSYAGGEGAVVVAPGPLSMMEAAHTGDLEVAVRASYEANLSAGFRADEATWAPFHEAALALRTPTEVVLRQVQAAFVHDTSERLDAITAPTLVIHGTDDEMIVYSNAAHVAGLIPGSVLHTFEGTGHLFWWEHPVETAALIREHCLARNSA